MASRTYLFVLITLLLSNQVKAHEDNLINGLKGDEINISSNSIIVKDDWYNNYIDNTDDDYFTVVSTEAKVKLWFDNSEMIYYSSDWEFEVTYTITLTDEDGIPTSYANQTLSINYFPSNQYTDINILKYNNDTYIKAEIEITDVSHDVPGASIPDDIHLDLELNTTRYYKLESTETPVVGYNTDYISTTKELEIYWSYIEGAESYDVEWLFIDIPDATLSTYNENYSFYGATRVNTLQNNYKISLAYPRGLFLFRVRPVGKEVVGSEVKRVEGTWSLSGAGTTGSVSTDEKYEWTGLLSSMNWQYSASFAEDGKKGEVLNIYDGSLKSRQSVTINNADNTAIISQPVYDYLGRPAISLLPVPETNQGLGFYVDRTKISASDYYDYEEFDIDTKVDAPDNMNGLGVNDYYNDNSTAIGVHSDYVADAGDYPYARTVFMNDGTGRVKHQTMVGNSYIGPSTMTGVNSHHVKYYYGTPTQEELYRLFGNEVGNASHYKKNMVVDQNGQKHITYIDMSGRTIATALACDAPDNLMLIDSYPDTLDEITSDLTVNNYIDIDGNLVISKTILVPCDTEYDFTYSLTGEDLTDPCLTGTIDVEYDLLIYVEDVNGDKVMMDFNGDMTDEDQWLVSGITAQTSLSWTETLPEGVYTIYKILSLDQSHIDGLFNTYKDSPSSSCYTYNATTGSTCNDCEDLCLSSHGFIDESGNTWYHNSDGVFVGYVDDQQTVTMLGSFVEATDLDPILAEISDCETNCNLGVQMPEINECDVKFDQMVADMSPGGQYFDDVPYGSFNTPDDDWMQTNLGNASNYFGWASDWDDVRDNWIDSYGTQLIYYHPEYCIWAVNCGRYQGDYEGGAVDYPNCPSGALGYAEYDNLMLMTTDDVEIGNSDPLEYLFNPLNMATVSSTANPETYQPAVDNLSNDELDPNVACYDAFSPHIETLLEQFLDADQAGSYHSIWWVLEDPDDGNAWSPVHDNLTNTHYPQETRDFYEYLHGDGTNPGIIGTGTNQITKYQFFRGVYMFLREYVTYMAVYDYDNFTTPSSSYCTGAFGYIETPNNDGLSSEGFVVHYPQNPLFENYDGNIDATFVQNEIGNTCDYQCAEYSAEWINSFASCCTTQTHKTIMAAYFEDICAATCDEDEPMGADDMSPSYVPTDHGWGTSFQTFEDVVDYHNTNFSEGLDDCEALAHPPVTADVIIDECECTNVVDFVTGFYISEGVTIPSSFDLDVDLTAQQETDIVDELSDYLTTSESSSPPDLTDIQGWIDDCESTSTTTGLPESFQCEDLPGSYDLSDVDADCGDGYDDLQSYYDLQAYNEEILEGWHQFLLGYTQEAWNTIITRETFTATYDLTEYHYTLFYYDQADNLVKTVPPAGVYRKTRGTCPGSDCEGYHNSILDATEIQDCFDHVDDPGIEPYIHPAHEMVTNYQYNSLQQLKEQTTPDGGKTTYFYDALGRMIVSQNAKQAAELYYTYSYLIYDELGRVIEAGEITKADQMTEIIALDASDYIDWLTTSTCCTTPERTEVIKTFYDDYADQTNTLAEFGMTTADLVSVRNRIGSVIYQDDYDASSNLYDYGIHYQYDYQGNVKSVIDHNNDAPVTELEYKKLDYTYDLVSGNVNRVNFQDGEDDAFYYKYEYDANNRLTVSYTSRDGVIWEKESKNFYYAHGPLARLEIGDQIVQARDFAYSINGWLKAVNSSVTNEDYDIGRDGKSGDLDQYSGKDVLSFSLHYFEDDYTAANTTTATDLFVDIDHSGYDAVSPDLYNGNISKMVISMYDLNGNAMDVHANGFQYDQLQRIKTSNTFKSGSGQILASNAVNGTTASDNGDFQTAYEFDGNGNLLNLSRNMGSSGTAMDDLTYHYDYDNAVSGEVVNRLTWVDDVVGSGVATVDVDDQSSGNYTYNQIGQLTSDNAENISSIEWTVTGKVKKMTFSSGMYSYVEFEYDPLDRRVSKTAMPTSYPSIPATTTYYSYDASGNVVATYDYETNGTTDHLYYQENHIYSNNRLGLINRNSVDLLTYSPPIDLSRALGFKYYEIAEHRGNVMNVISDRKLAVNSGGDIIAYEAEIIENADYYPYGMPIEDRVDVAINYRYGFQGQERDDEIKGNGNSINYKYRMHDPRVGRFFAVDPLASKYPHYSTYSFSGNEVINKVELEGLEPGYKSVPGQDPVLAPYEGSGKYHGQERLWYENGEGGWTGGPEEWGVNFSTETKRLITINMNNADQPYVLGMTRQYGAEHKYMNFLQTSGLWRGLNDTKRNNITGYYGAMNQQDAANNYGGAYYLALWPTLFVGGEGAINSLYTLYKGANALYHLSKYTSTRWVGSSRSNYVYRSLTSSDAASIKAGNGVWAKAPGGNWTVEQHVIHGSTPSASFNSPWISTSKDINIAMRFSSGHGLARINLSQLPATSVYESWALIPKSSQAYHFSVWQREVSIFQHIPQSAIKIIR